MLETSFCHRHYIQVRAPVPRLALGEVAPRGQPSFGLDYSLPDLRIILSDSPGSSDQAALRFTTRERAETDPFRAGTRRCSSPCNLPNRVSDVPVD